jgi:hypothetical protein
MTDQAKAIELLREARGYIYHTDKCAFPQTDDPCDCGARAMMARISSYLFAHEQNAAPQQGDNANLGNVSVQTAASAAPDQMPEPTPEDWRLIQEMVNDDCSMGIVADIAQKECTWEQGADRICAYAIAAWKRALALREKREGWVMIPREPTAKMLDAGYRQYCTGMTGKSGLRLLSCVGSIGGHGFTLIDAAMREGK